MAAFLTTYRPLVGTKAGRVAATKYAIPPFVDGSCRREPDFEAAYPSISGLCHGDKFVPRVHVDDQVLFLTKKASYFDDPERHWRFVATLRVVARCESHEDAARWYRTRGFEPPSNCLVNGTAPVALDKTDLHLRDVRTWELSYQARARKCGVFLICEPEYMELHAPPRVTEELLCSVFGKPPVTRNPPRICLSEARRLQKLATAGLQSRSLPATSRSHVRSRRVP